MLLGGICIHQLPCAADGSLASCLGCVGSWIARLRRQAVLLRCVSYYLCLGMDGILSKYKNNSGSSIYLPVFR